MSDNIQIKRIIDESNPDLRVYFSREELAPVIEQAERGQVEPEIESPFLKAVLEIPGVSMAIVRPYAIAVIKAPCFEFDEIEPSLKRLMASFNMGECSLMKEDEKESI